MRFHTEYSLRVDAFVAICLAASTLGYHAVRHAPRPEPTLYEDRAKEIMIARVLSVLGIIGCLLQLGGAAATGTQLSISYLLENLTTIRSAAFDQLEEARSSPLGFIDGYLASFSFLSVIAAARLGREGGRSLVTLGIANFVLASLVGLFLTGGRTTLFYAALVVLVSLYVSGRKVAILKLRTLAVAGLAIVVVGYFSVAFLNTRSSSGSTNPDQILEVTQRAEYHPLLAKAAQASPALGTALVSVGYFASPLPTLSFYLQREPIPGPFWGAYSFPLPARVAAGLTGSTPRSLAVTRSEVFAPLESAGYEGNVWATWLRDLVIDFGYYGAVLFCAAFCAFMAWSRNRFEATGALHYHYLEVLSCFTLAFGAFTSVLPFTLIASAFFTAIGVMYLTRLQVRKPAARARDARGDMSRDQRCHGALNRWIAWRVSIRTVSGARFTLSRNDFLD